MLLAYTYKSLLNPKSLLFIILTAYCFALFTVSEIHSCTFSVSTNKVKGDDVERKEVIRYVDILFLYDL